MLTLKGSPTTWYPISVSDLEGHLQQVITPISGYSAKECRGLRKNIAYSLQQIEFIDRCLKDLAISAVISTLNQKTSIIICCSIIEALFFYLLRKQGRAAKTEWLSKSRISGQPFRDACGATRKIDCEIFEKVSPEVFEEMSFDTMCKRVEDKKLVHLSNDLFYKKLPYLRRLRNRVHIHILKDDSDTDYISITTTDYNLARKTLYLLLTSSLFPVTNANHFSHLNA